ncbi:MAG: sensor histidine kinase [Xenococcaceae cyanobacterium]
MAWDIGSTQISNPQFRSLRSRLLLSYLGVMATILGTSGIAVYHWVARDLNQELNNHLLTLAEAAAQTLEIVKHEYYEYEEGEDEDDRDRTESTPKLSHLMAEYERDGLVYTPAQHPLHYYQGIEWFDERQQLLIQEGNLSPSWLLSENLDSSDLILQKGRIRSLALPVQYVPPESKNQEITGYIRTSQSTEWLDTELQRLCLGLGLGGIIALGLTAFGGMWLTGESLKPLKKSFQQLKQFTADASHELRSPLTAIKSSVSVLQNHPERIHLTDVKKIEAIASATNQMTRLVEDLLLLARMEGAITTITLEKIPVPIDEILEDLLDDAELEAQQKQITLKSELLTNVFVNADGQQLKRLFSNLLDNALQYTPAGGMVKVSLSRSQDRAIVTIEDTGIGIAPQDLPYVFDRLWRAEGAKACRQKGTGLGMAIAQTIARVHGGKITVTSELGVGSCLRVQLPISSRT